MKKAMSASTDRTTCIRRHVVLAVLVYRMRMQLLASVYYPLVRVIYFGQQLAVCVDSISEGETAEYLAS